MTDKPLTTFCTEFNMNDWSKEGCAVWVQDLKDRLLQLKKEYCHDGGNCERVFSPRHITKCELCAMIDELLAELKQ
jgi:hypothetical protein